MKTPTNIFLAATSLSTSEESSVFLLEMVDLDTREKRVLCSFHLDAPSQVGILMNPPLFRRALTAMIQEIRSEFPDFESSSCVFEIESVQGDPWALECVKDPVSFVRSHKGSLGLSLSLREVLVRREEYLVKFELDSVQKRLEEILVEFELYFVQKRLEGLYDFVATPHDSAEIRELRARKRSIEDKIIMRGWNLSKK